MKGGAIGRGNKVELERVGLDTGYWGGYGMNGDELGLGFLR